MGESGIFYVQFWSLQNLVWGLERTTLSLGESFYLLDCWLITLITQFLSSPGRFSLP